MKLMNEKDFEIEKQKNQKKIKKIIICIIVLLMMCAVCLGAVAYKMYDPDKLTIIIDGKDVSDLRTIMDIQIDENGKTIFYIPIREFGQYLNKANPELGYVTYKGDYDPQTEEENKCYIERKGIEVTLFSANSKDVYKMNLQKQNSEYEQYTIDKNVYLNKGKLYTSVEGIEKGYNVFVKYDETNKTITINSLDKIITNVSQSLEQKGENGSYGKLKVTEIYSDYNAVNEGGIVVKADSGTYGILNANDFSKYILEPKYDKIEYIPETTDYLVTSNGKVGLFSKDGRRKIEMMYEQLTQIGQDSKLYVMKANNQYGVVDENGNTIIYPEFDQIGIDVKQFAYNGIKKGYIILNKLIPVKEKELWAFFDTKGKPISGNSVQTAFKYTNIGYRTSNSDNIYSLLVIPEYNVIVVGDKSKKYGFMNINGVERHMLFNKIYIKVSSGKALYKMTRDNFDGEEDVLELLKATK